MLFSSIRFCLVWFGLLSTLARQSSLIRIRFGLGLPLPLVDSQFYFPDMT